KSTLNDSARARIARTIAQQGPRVVRRARIERIVVRASMAVSAVAVVAIVAGLTMHPRAHLETPPVLSANRCDAFPAWLGARGAEADRRRARRSDPPVAHRKRARRDRACVRLQGRARCAAGSLRRARTGAPATRSPSEARASRRGEVCDRRFAARG